MRDSGAWQGAVPAGTLNGLAGVLYRNAEDLPAAEVVSRRGPGGEWERVTSARLLSEVTAVAKGLIGAGVGVGDRVVLVGDARYEQMLLQFAVWAVRAVAVPLPAACSPKRLLAVVRDCRPAAVVLQDGRQADAAATASREVPDLGRVWRLDGPEGLEAVTRPGAYMDSSSVRFRMEEVVREDPAVIDYPASAAGPGRGAVLTHGNRLDAADALVRRLAPALAGLEPGEASALMRLSLADHFGQAALAACMLARVRLGVLEPRADLPSELRTFKPSVLVTGPELLERLYRAESDKARQTGWDNHNAFGAATELAVDFDKAGRKGAWRRVSKAMYEWMYTRIREALGGRVRLVVVAGAPMTARMDHFFNGAGVPLVQVCGTAEAGGAFCANGPGDRRAGTHGRALEGAEVRPGPGGELFVRGPGVFPGYWNDPDASREALRDGWLATGVAGEVDGDGYVTVQGRLRVQACAAPVRPRGAEQAPGGAGPGADAGRAAPEAQSGGGAGGAGSGPAEPERPAAVPQPSPEELVADLERRLRSHSLVSQAMVIGRGRPYCTALVTLASDQLEYWRLVNNRPLNTPPEEIASDPELLREISAAVGEANQAVPPQLAVRAFHVLAEEFTVQSGLVLPGGELRRDAVLRAFADEIEGLYRSPEPGRQG
ncbi:AMP-dependent synthetase/ligase [Nocardiopsis chromatogenes]|uniref:AMP-dependent synthetase/ligase n=1 Tax=Nocardiopsis chromatogenes TaxID=280239 RepID=UPI000345F4BF|nr:AMP-binding protein [Nocardiopsis chromatogenes]